MIVEQKEILYKGKIIFERLSMSSDFHRVPKLFKENEACFLFITKGTFHFRTPKNLLYFQEGDGVLAKCGNYFIESPSITNQTSSQLISVIGAFFYPEMVKQFFENDLSLSQFQDSYDVKKINIDPLINSFIDSIHYLLDHPSLIDDNLILTKLKELLLLLSKSEKASSIYSFVNYLFVNHEYEFHKIIQQNIYSNLSIPEFAYLCNKSLSAFKRIFMEYYGESPAKFILVKKLEKSTILLSNSSKSIAEVAYESGFENVSNFNKAFKKHYGNTPTAYKLSQIDKELNQ